MGWACGTHGKEEKYGDGFARRNLKEADRLEREEMGGKY